MTQKRDPATEGTRVRVRFSCPTCGGDVAIASTWCRECWIKRRKWVRVLRHREVIDDGD